MLVSDSSADVMAFCSARTTSSCLHAACCLSCCCFCSTHCSGHNHQINHLYLSCSNLVVNKQHGLCSKKCCAVCATIHSLPCTYCCCMDSNWTNLDSVPKLQANVAKQSVAQPCDKCICPSACGEHIHMLILPTWTAAVHTLLSPSALLAVSTMFQPFLCHSMHQVSHLITYTRRFLLLAVNAVFSFR